MVPTSIIRPDIRSFSLHYKYEVLLNHRLTCLCLFSNVCLQKLLLLISGVVWLVVNVLMVWDGVVWRTPTGVSTHFKHLSSRMGISLSLNVSGVIGLCLYGRGSVCRRPEAPLRCRCGGGGGVSDHPQTKTQL